MSKEPASREELLDVLSELVTAMRMRAGLISGDIKEDPLAWATMFNIWNRSLKRANDIEEREPDEEVAND